MKTLETSVNDQLISLLSITRHLMIALKYLAWSNSWFKNTLTRNSTTIEKGVARERNRENQPEEEDNEKDGDDDEDQDLNQLEPVDTVADEIVNWLRFVTV